MACNSIQSSSMTWKHDVFVSFRGDTRNSFTDHLFGALHREGIVTFRDDKELKRGKPITPELLQAIEGSRVFIVIFSKNYASSTWCLRELAKIVDCLKVSGKRVLPVFYDVDPSEVRKQSGNYQKAFAEYEETFKENLEMMVQVQRWRGALTQVANLAGWDVRDKPQYAEIEKIIKEATSILGHKFSSLPGDIVGMHSRVEELEKLLVLDSYDDVRVVGICGMGGIGKTTLATALYDKFSHQYDVSYFIDDIRKIYGDYGPIGAQKQLLCQAVSEENLHICSLSMATNLIRTRLWHRKALIILDNVDQVKQLEKLAMKREWLGEGSRIIIISRDEHILREYGVDEVYKVQLLNYENGLQLFCRKAFRCDDIMRDYSKLAYDVLRYAGGLPLAIKVLGSFLFGRDVSEWKSALARLSENPSKDIMDVLRMSFDGLEEMDKEIFLDIACFFYDNAETHVKKFLEFRGFYPDIGIRVLIDRSLITCEHRKILMHDLLKELGRSIVREKSPKEPSKWSRLWDYKDLHNVMLENKATENLEAIVLQRHPANIKEVLEMTTLRVEALSQMSRLKLLILWNLNFSGSLCFLSNELRYLSWEKYPFMSLPSSFQPDKLVELILPHSSIKQLWQGTKRLHNLRCMDLSHSKNLIKMPDFREVPNLEWLNLEGCIKLVRIDPSISFLRKLASLNLKDCKNLVSIPNNIVGLGSLKGLNLSGCTKLFNNQLLEKPRHMKHLKMFDTGETAIQCHSTSSICKMLMLAIHFLYSRWRHEDSVNLLWSSLPSFPCLCSLDLSFCSLLQIPDAIGCLPCLKRLNLGGNNFVTLPSSIKKLSKLRYLNLEHCKQLKYLPELPSSIVSQEKGETFFGRFYADLYIFNCPNLIELERCCSMALSWIIQGLKVHMQSFHLFGQVNLVIPGTQVSRWFNEQNIGSSICMDPSPIMRDNNWIGVACCATFVAHDDPTNLGNGRKAYIAWGFPTKLRSFYYHIPILLEKHLVTVESDHLLLLFFSREAFIENYVSSITKGKHDLDGIKFATIINQPQGLHLEVKNIGYRWMFKEDLEQLNPTMMHCGNSSMRKRKFLTIDDQP